MNEQFCHCAGRLRGQPGEPIITIECSRFHGFVAVAQDDRGNRIAIWAQTEADAKARATLLWAAL